MECRMVAHLMTILEKSSLHEVDHHENGASYSREVDIGELVRSAGLRATAAETKETTLGEGLKNSSNIENFEEEVAETMAETMEEYMSKIRADYGSGVTRPKIDDKFHFELKGQFLKELRDNTFSGSNHKDANEHIEIVLEIEVILFYNELEVSTRQILDSKGAIPTKIAADAKVAIQEMAKYSQKWYNGTSKARSLGELAHTKLTVELADRTVKHPKGIVENVLVGIGEEKIIFKCVKPASSLIKRVYMLSLRGRMELDLEARLMGETLVLNRSLDPLYGDYIELTNLNIPLELRRNQVDDLMPTIEEGEVVDKPMTEEVKTRNDNKMVSKIIGYPSVVEDMNPYLDEGLGEVVVGVTPPNLQRSGISLWAATS
ncbi:hypothetical protein Tco_1274138 [Tanacetum coccineum]